MTLLPIAAPAPTPNGAPLADVASTSGDFAALLALVASGAPSPDSDRALPKEAAPDGAAEGAAPDGAAEGAAPGGAAPGGAANGGAAPEPATSDLQADLGEPGRNQAIPPEAVPLVALPIPMRAAAPADPSSPGLPRPTERPVGKRPAAPAAVEASPVAAVAASVPNVASPVAPAASPVVAAASPVAAGAVRASVEDSPAHMDAPPPPPPAVAGDPPTSVGDAPPGPVEAPGGGTAAIPAPVERPLAEVLPPGRGRPAVHVPVPSVAIEASPALAESAPAPIRTGDAARSLDTDPVVVAAQDATAAAPVLAEESPVVPENLLPGRRVVHTPLPSADVPASAPLPAAAVRTEAARPADVPAATPMAPPAVPEQIVSAVVPLHGRGDGRHEVTLELRPEDLGPIRVEVSVEQQTVHLTLHAAEPATGRLLSAALAELRTALADAGLQAGHLAVSPDSGGATGRRSRPEPPNADKARGESTTPARVRTLRPSAAGRLDLLL